MSTLTAAWHPRLLRRGANRAEASAIRASVRKIWRRPLDVKLRYSRVFALFH